MPKTEWGNPILAKRAKDVPVSKIRTSAMRSLSEKMIYTMRRSHGVGLAANQVGVALNVAVLEMRPTPTRPKLPSIGPLTVFNPKILKYSKEQVSDWEGCLSFEGVRGKVARSKKITVSYYDLRANKIVEAIEGFWARIFQHEVDHLNGVTYVERVQDLKTLMTIGEFKKRVLKQKPARRPASKKRGKR